jgi:hypothetical protein
MIPTALILVFLAALVCYGVYLMVSSYAKVTEPTAEEKRKAADADRWRQGYAFDTLKVPANAYTKMWDATPREMPSYIDLKSFTAIIFTRQHGTYLSGRVENIKWGDDSINLTIVFPVALGDTIVEYFIVLNGENELVSDGTGFQEFPVTLNKGDQFQITQTLNLRGEDDKV